MADTNFVPGTLVTSDWLNDVNDFVYPTGPTVTSRLPHDIYVTDPQFGAINDGPSGADSTVALRAAVTFANALYDIVLDSISTSYKPRLIFPPGKGFKITLADGEVGLSIRAGVEVIMQSPLWVAAPANAAVIGIDYVDDRNIAFQGPRETSPVFNVRRITRSDGGTEFAPRDGDIAVRIPALYVGFPFFKHISDFCVGVQARLGYGQATLGEFRNCRKGLVIQGAGTLSGFTNHLRVTGGTFAMGSGVYPGWSRYGVVLKGEAPGMNTIYFDGQSFELATLVAGAADCLAYLVDSGVSGAVIGVRVTNQRTEQSGKTFARLVGVVRNCEFGILDGELPTTNPTELLLDDQSTAGGCNFAYRYHYPSGPAWKCFFDTGRLVNRAVALSGSAQHFINLERAANVGAAPAVQTFSATGAGATFDSAGFMTTNSVLTGVRVRLNGAKTIGIRGNRPPSGATSVILLCFDSAGNQITTLGAVRTTQFTTPIQTTAYGGFYSITLVSDVAPQNTATHFEAAFAFSSDVAVVFFAPTTPVSSWSLHATDSRPQWFSESDHALNQFLGDAVPVAFTNVTYKKGMRVNRYSPVVGQTTGWVLDSGGTWRALANL